MNRPYLTHPIHLKYEFARKKEKFIMWIVWRLPRSIVYWSAIRLIAHGTQGEYGDQHVGELTAMHALDRWNT